VAGPLVFQADHAVHAHPELSGWDRRHRRIIAQDGCVFFLFAELVELRVDW